MAIGNLPPWLAVQPTDFLQASRSGVDAGLQVAQMRQRAREQAAALAEARARQAQAAWETRERMRIAAQNAMEERAQNAAMMDYRNRQLESQMQRERTAQEIDRAQLAELSRHNLATETISEAKAKDAVDRGEASVITFPELPGMKFIRQNTGNVIPIDRGTKEPTQLQKDTILMRATALQKPSGYEKYTDPEGFRQRSEMAQDIINRYSIGGNPSSGTVQMAEEVPPIPERVAGKSYKTPKGVFIWTGTGWRQP